MTLQTTLEELNNLFKPLKNKKANTKTIINKLMIGIETLLDTMTIALQNGRESN